jgi:O-antigen/teichoic acid export membrane protein
MALSSTNIFPTSCSIFSEELIVLLYEEKWKLAKPFLFYLSISGIFGFISGYNISVLSIIGNSKIILKVEIINKIQRVVLIVLCLLLSFSINYFLCSILVASIINYLIVNFYVSKYLKIKCTQLILLFLKCLSFSGLSVFLSYLFFYRFNLILNPILDLSMSLLLGILFYFGIVYYFNKKLVNDIIDLLNTKPN